MWLCYHPFLRTNAFYNVEPFGNSDSLCTYIEPNTCLIGPDSSGIFLQAVVSDKTINECNRSICTCLAHSDFLKVAQERMESALDLYQLTYGRLPTEVKLFTPENKVLYNEIKEQERKTRETQNWRNLPKETSKSTYLASPNLIVCEMNKRFSVLTPK